MPVTRDDLSRDRLDGESHGPCDVRFYARINLREGADRPRNRAGGDLFAGVREPLARTRELRVGIGELEAEGRGLGVDAVGSADGRSHLVLDGATLERGEQPVDIGDQE